MEARTTRTQKKAQCVSTKRNFNGTIFHRHKGDVDLIEEIEEINHLIGKPTKAQNYTEQEFTRRGNLGEKDDEEREPQDNIEENPKLTIRTLDEEGEVNSNEEDIGEENPYDQEEEVFIGLEKPPKGKNNTEHWVNSNEADISEESPYEKEEEVFLGLEKPSKGENETEHRDKSSEEEEFLRQPGIFVTTAKPSLNTGCERPRNPQHGEWDCDAGMTQCMLQCHPGFPKVHVEAICDGEKWCTDAIGVGCYQESTTDVRLIDNVEIDNDQEMTKILETEDNGTEMAEPEKVNNDQEMTDLEIVNNDQEMTEVKIEDNDKEITEVKIEDNALNDLGPSKQIIKKTFSTWSNEQGERRTVVKIETTHHQFGLQLKTLVTYEDENGQEIDKPDENIWKMIESEMTVIKTRTYGMWGDGEGNQTKIATVETTTDTGGVSDTRVTYEDSNGNEIDKPDETIWQEYGSEYDSNYDLPGCSGLPSHLEQGSWSCFPKNPPYDNCTLVCGDNMVPVGGTNRTEYTCDGRWEDMGEVACKRCDENAQTNTHHLCECKIGFGGNGFLCGPDHDFDGFPDDQLDCDDTVTCRADNCPARPNVGQENLDGDEFGDLCDDDVDGDGIRDEGEIKKDCSENKRLSLRRKLNLCFDNKTCAPEQRKHHYNQLMTCVEKKDNCPFQVNKEQEDQDHDMVGDMCDNCPEVFNPNKEDLDNDGIGDACDDDQDGDLVPNSVDNCPLAANEDQLDSDGDGIGDICDNCKNVTNKGQADDNQNNIGDACENGSDDDKDGIDHFVDNCPMVANADQTDTDEDGQGDACDKDIDGDGVVNIEDNCPFVSNKDQIKQNNEERGDACLEDYDGDGMNDTLDVCPENRAILTTDFNKMKTIDLCAQANLEDGRTTTCAKEEPVWESRDNGRTIYQARNSRVSIGIGEARFSDLDYNGTLFIEDEIDNDWVGFIFGMQNLRKFYLVIANRHHKSEANFLPWQITRVMVDDKNKKYYNTTIKSLQRRKSVKGYTKVLWKDKNNHQWKSKTSIRWVLQHRPSKGIINLKMYESDKEIINTGDIIDKEIQGGKIGVFCMSQEKVEWSGLSYSCPTKDRFLTSSLQDKNTYKEEEGDFDGDYNYYK